MTCTAAAFCALLDISGTVVTLGPTDHPRADAEIVMQNNLSNGQHDDATYPMAWGDISASVTFTWDKGTDGSDALTVTPPPGMVCDPLDCTMTVPETGRGVVYLLPWEGM